MVGTAGFEPVAKLYMINHATVRCGLWLGSLSMVVHKIARYSHQNATKFIYRAESIFRPSI
jgi:hypothetical protein